MVFGGHLENMQIRSIKSHFSACQHWFLDSAYPNTPDSDLKPFSSQNACTIKTKRLFRFFVLTIVGKEVEVLYYPSSEHEEADLRLCFRICKTLVFSRGGSFTAIVITLIIHTGISNGEIYDVHA